MATETSTRQKLHSIVDDMELISKELIEQLAMPKSQRRPDAPETEDLMQLLIEKDTELKDTLKIAEEQEKVQKVMDSLKAEVTKRDTEVRHLQRTLKEAETIMATAVYQAKQKLAAVRQAQDNKVASEDLIKYAHRISASNAVSAPPTWGPGDPRRPYPTDLEMRLSFLSSGTLTDSAPLSASTTAGPGNVSRLYAQAQPPPHQHQPSAPPHPAALSGQHHFAHQLSSSSTSSASHPTTLQQAPSFSWQSSQDSAHPIGHTAHKDEDDVEHMSSNSSSCSSSSDECM